MALNIAKRTILDRAECYHIVIAFREADREPIRRVAWAYIMGVLTARQLLSATSTASSRDDGISVSTECPYQAEYLCCPLCRFTPTCRPTCHPSRGVHYLYTNICMTEMVPYTFDALMTLSHSPRSTSSSPMRSNTFI